MERQNIFGGLIPGKHKKAVFSKHIHVHERGELEHGYRPAKTQITWTLGPGALSGDEHAWKDGYWSFWHNLSTLRPAICSLDDQFLIVFLGRWQGSLRLHGALATFSFFFFFFLLSPDGAVGGLHYLLTMDHEI
jgi:hypothetical protein